MPEAFICDAIRTPFGRYSGRAFIRRTAGGRCAVCTLCIGVGQGIALVIERI